MTSKQDKVKRAMAGARPVEDAPFDPSAVPGDTPKKSRARKVKSSSPESPDGAPPPPPEDGEPSLARLTPEQWKVLERCSGWDENDTDNGKRLLAWFGNMVLAVNEAGWFGWTGTHWDSETGQLAVERYAQQIVPMIKREAALLVASEEEAAAIAEAARLKEAFPKVRERDEDTRELIKLGETIAKAVMSRRAGRFQFAIRSGDRARTKAMIDQAAPHRTVLPRAMDSEDLALNTMAGTLRFKREIDPDCPDPDVVRHRVTRRLDAHRPDDYISKVTAASYDPKAMAPQFRRDLIRFMPDVANREFLQVFAGYSALGITGEQVYAYLYGDGSNWKSACVNAIGRSLGTYTKPMMYSSITGNNTPSGDKPSPDWARLPGVRMLVIEEVPKNEPLKEELIKMITSGSDMPVRHLNKGLFDMRTTFTAWMLSNGEPNINGGDHGIWRRTLIVRWDVTIPEAERRPFDQVMAMYEGERPGILNWVIEGIEKYLANGLSPYITDDMRAFRDSVRRDRDAVGTFVEDCVQVTDDNYWVPAREFYKAFVRWCGVNGVDPVPSETSFGRKIKRVPVDGVPMEKRKRSIEGMKRFYGIKLHNLPPDEHPYAPTS